MSAEEEVQSLLAIDPILDPSALIHPQSDSQSNNASTGHLLSKNQAVLSLSKGIAGAGLFSLSFGLSQSGILLGVLIMLVVTFLAADTVKLLVACKEYVEQSINQSNKQPINQITQRLELSSRSNRHTSSFEQPDMQPGSDNQLSSQPISHSLTYLDLGSHLLGPYAGHLVSAAVIACSVGVSTAYLDFIQCMGQSINRSINLLVYPDQPINHSINPAIYLLPTLPFIVMLSLIRSYRVLSLTALIGDISIMVGSISVVLYGIFYSDSHRSIEKMTSEYQNQSFDQSINSELIYQSNFPSFLSTAAFLFCVHFFTLPIFSNLSNKHHSVKVINQSFSLTSFVSLSIGLIGWYCFGHSIKPVIIANLPATSLTIVFVKVMLAIDMVLSYAIVLFPGREIIEKWACRDPLLNNQTTDDCLNGSLDDRMTHHSNGSDHHHSNRSNNHTELQSSHLLDDQDINPSAKQDINQSSLASIKQSIKRRFHHQSISTQHVIVRICIILLTIYLSIFIPRFDVVIGLVGGVSMCSLAFIFPCCMALSINQSNNQAINKQSELDVWNHLYSNISEHSTDQSINHNSRSINQWWWRPWYFYTVMCFGFLIICLTIFQSVRLMVATINNDHSTGIC